MWHCHGVNHSPWRARILSLVELDSVMKWALKESDGCEVRRSDLLFFPYLHSTFELQMPQDESHETNNPRRRERTESMNALQLGPRKKAYV